MKSMKRHICASVMLSRGCDAAKANSRGELGAWNEGSLPLTTGTLPLTLSQSLGEATLLVFIRERQEFQCPSGCTDQHTRIDNDPWYAFRHQPPIL